MNDYRVNPSQDLPSAYSAKKVVFYQHGIKIYGVLPFRLNRKVKGEFRSNETRSFIFPTWEGNYTLVPYGLADETIEALLAWLVADAGFCWAVAGPRDWYRDDLYTNNVMKDWPKAFHYVEEKPIEGFSEPIKGEADFLRAWLKGENRHGVAQLFDSWRGDRE